MQAAQEPIYRFGAFRLSPDSGLLEYAGARVPLTPKVLLTLAVLVRSAGSVVEHETLMNEVWAGVFVAPHGLTRNISVLRRTLSELEPGAAFIETIPKYGYRFIHPVESGPPRSVHRLLRSCQIALRRIVRTLSKLRPSNRLLTSAALRRLDRSARLSDNRHVGSRHVETAS